MSKLIPLAFETNPVRVVMLNDNPLFSARDVAVALGYANPSEAYNDHCKLLKKLSYSELLELNWVNPNRQGEYVIPQSDVLRLIVKSNKPEAVRFEKWVFEEVLPSILKTGSYSIPESAPETPAFDKAEFRETLSFMACAKDFAEKVIGLVDSQALLSANQVTFKATGTDVLAYFHHTCIPANPKGLTYNPTELGDLLNPVRSARWINKELARAGLQVNINGKWEPTDKAKRAGVFEWTDVGKRHHDGMPVKQLRWFKDALEYVVQDRREAA